MPSVLRLWGMLCRMNNLRNGQSFTLPRLLLWFHHDQVGYDQLPLFVLPVVCENVTCAYGTRKRTGPTWLAWMSSAELWFSCVVA